MKLGPRIQSVIDILEQIEDTPAPADAVMGNYFHQRRYIGSSDRGFIAEMVYDILRILETLIYRTEKSGLRVSPRTLALTACHHLLNINATTLENVFTGDKYAPNRIDSLERKAFGILEANPTLPDDAPDFVRYNHQEWFTPLLQNRFKEHYPEELEALNHAAPVDLRANTLKISRNQLQKRLADEGIFTQPTPFSQHGLRLERRLPVFATECFKEGLFEVQDEGSQLIAQVVGARPGEIVIDFCAGAGGKTLALAASMRNKGRIHAWDISEKRISELRKRAKRAGMDNAAVHILSSENDTFIKRYKGKADRVLLDVPCSGSGTWRRNPDLKWRYDEKDLEELRVKQRSILQSASRLVKPSGTLIYATCSVFAEENSLQIEQFLTENKHFAVNPIGSVLPFLDDECKYMELTAKQHNTDGFFAALLQRTE